METSQGLQSNVEAINLSETYYLDQTNNYTTPEITEGTELLIVIYFLESGDEVIWNLDNNGSFSNEIYFEPITNKTYGEDDFSLMASSTYDLPVTFTSNNSNIISIEGDRAKIRGVGSVTITASQNGNDTIAAADPINQTFNVLKLNQVIQFDTLVDVTYGQVPKELALNTDLGLPITYSSDNEDIAVVESGILSYTGIGTVTIMATQSGNDTIASASPVSYTFEVKKQPQEINGAPLDEYTYGDGPIKLSFSTTSGLNLIYNLSNTNIASVEGDSIYIKNAGATILSINQPGNDTVSAATQVDHILLVNKASQIINITSIATQFIDASPIEVMANASSGLPLIYTIQGPATIMDEMITLSGETGTVTLTAEQVGDNNFLSSSKDLSFDVIDPCIGFQVEIVEVVNPSCFGELEGSFSAEISAGTAPFTISINGELNSTNTFEGLGAGEYQVEVIDNNGCLAIAQISLTQPDSIIVEASIENATSFEGNGFISLFVTGGSGSYTYNWNTGATSKDINELIPGEYSVTVTDNKGCVETKSFELGGVTSSRNSLNDALTVYPNPTSNFVMIDHPRILAETAAYLYDTKGVVVKEFNLKGSFTKLDFIELRAGIYLFKVEGYNGHVKLLKQ